MVESGYFNNGNFREYSYFAGRILQSWKGNSRWPWCAFHVSHAARCALCNQRHYVLVLWNRVRVLLPGSVEESSGNCFFHCATKTISETMIFEFAQHTCLGKRWQLALGRALGRIHIRLPDVAPTKIAGIIMWAIMKEIIGLFRWVALCTSILL